jgi:hypothetical protein
VERIPDPAGQEIRETYTYDRKGIIHLEIANLTGGYRKEYTFGLTPK